MDFSCFGINQFGKGIDVGIEEFFQSAEFQNLVNYGMPVFQLYQNLFSGGVLLAFSPLCVWINF